MDGLLKNMFNYSIVYNNIIMIHGNLFSSVDIETNQRNVLYERATSKRKQKVEYKKCTKEKAKANWKE